MKHLELHILQSVPVSCLNRDDLNSPKTAIFGGVQRARVSSQSWKRAIREMAREYMPNVFADRTKRLVFEFSKRFKDKGVSEKVAVVFSEKMASILSKLDTSQDDAGYAKAKTICFLSPNEFSAITDVVLESEEGIAVINKLNEFFSSVTDGDLSENDKKKMEKILKETDGVISKKDVGKAIKSVQLKDAADVALFGRMVADDHSLAVEAASMFSHAISTHKVDNEIDFFTAVDDLQPNDEGGAAMMGSLEYNSATYYRFAALNLDMLKDENHLAAMSQEQRKEIVGNFVKSSMMAMPGARKNTMNGNTLPGLVKIVIREKGHPIQLINAFEDPVVKQRNSSLFEESCKRMKNEYLNIKELWGLDEKECITFGKYADGVNEFVNLTDVLEKVKSYVE